MDNPVKNSLRTSPNSTPMSKELNAYIAKVYNWMAFALFTTGLVTYLTAKSQFLTDLIFSSKLVFYALLIGELLLFGYLVSVIDKLSAKNTILLFISYAALNGLTISFIFLIYTTASIATTFYISGGTFGIMSLFGYYTKKNLTTVRNMGYMGLVGIILASIFNWFFQNELIYWIVTYLGILIFLGLVAYDTQKIRQIGMQGFSSNEDMEKCSIIGALHLYLDFINLFLLLLRIFGNKK
jgi:FtsH-binding integral membrane protein